MTNHVEHTLRVNLPASQVWEILDDFSSIERFSIAVENSPLLPGKRSGLGTKRKCDFYNGTSVIEEIVGYEEGKSLQIELSEYAMPLKSLHAEMKVEAVDSNTSDLYMSMDFVVKGGLAGWLMGFFMMRPMMKGVLKKTLTGLAYHAATGQVIGKKLPTENELAPAIA